MNAAANVTLPRRKMWKKKINPLPHRLHHRFHTNLKYMKKIYLIAFAALLLAAGACDTKKEKERAAKQENSSQTDSLQNVITQMNKEMGDLGEMKTTLNDIIRQINETEGRVTATQAEGSDNQAIIENMAFIQRKMNEYRKTVDEMRQQLRNAKLITKEAKKGYEADIEAYVKILKEKDAEIEALRIQLAEKELVITEQGTTIAEQDEMVNDLTAENQAKEQALIEQDQKLHTAWYVFGTKKELKEENILVDNKVMQSKQANNNYFTKIDIRVNKTIKLYSKDAKLLTNHPAGSYTLDKDAQGLLTLRISDPYKFWSVSRYLVITVK